MLKLSQKNKITIGLDLDDTIIDHQKNRLFLSKKLNVSAKDKSLKKILYAEMSITAPPMTGAVETIRKFIKNGREIIIVSRRRADGHESARNWLKLYLPEISPQKIFFVEADEEKNLVCLEKKVGIFVDDSQNVLDHLDSKIEKILFTKNWDEIGKIVTKF